MALNVTIYKSSAELNRVTKNTYLNNALQFTSVVLKAPSELLNPVIRIQTSSDLTGYNYCYISDLSRYYFMEKPVLIRDDLWEFSCRVDVLMSHKTGIGNLVGIIARQQSSYNNLVFDDRRTYQNNFTYTTISANEATGLYLPESAADHSLCVILTAMPT